MTVFEGLLFSMAFFASQALGPEWHDARDGDWRYEDPARQTIRQVVSDVRADVFTRFPANAGTVWRTSVEPAPGAYRSGIWIGLSDNPLEWLLLVLDAEAGHGRGFALLNGAGTVLWEDSWAPWVYYTPYVMECVVETDRVRVQLFEGDAKTLISQSDWIAVKFPQRGRELTLGFHTDQSVARFRNWELAASPLSPLVDNAPNKLRLQQGPESEWVVVGGGNWAWTTPERKVLRQAAVIERTTAVSLTISQETESTWQTRIKVDSNAGGAGMLFLTDEKAESGFIAWLGGNPGAGGLMLYTLSPNKALWSSPQNTWHFDTEYLLEASLRDGAVSARLLTADGQTELAASPPFPLVELNAAQGRFLGYQTWKGTAEFQVMPSGPIATAAAGPTAPAAMPGWQVLSGEWTHQDDAVTGTAVSGGPARILNTGVRGAKGVWTCRVTPESADSAFALLFQAGSDANEGFQLSVGTEVVLTQLGGRVLWRQDDVKREPGELVLEGIVSTDRVRVRVANAAGQTLAESTDCYVSDTNNTRQGALGFEVSNGAARFSMGAFSPAE
ncbi:MAG: hypothetical protein IT364_24315 [Candidatus Hydrogenedentes bacterium]|nr:hypothetical protein [Candidatus Hydrogenedentota bacterium]